MRVHRYFADHGNTTLMEGRLRLSKPSQFNDPFECVHRFAGEYNAGHAAGGFCEMPEDEVMGHLRGIYGPSLPLKAGQRPVDLLGEYFVSVGGRAFVDPDECQNSAEQLLSMCCFSNANSRFDNEILLWSYYGNKHCGVRIEFEIDENTMPIFHVKYSKERHAVNLHEDGSYDFGKFDDVLLTKAKIWEIEDEVRLIINKRYTQEIQTEVGPVHYFPFERQWVTGVDLGIRCDPKVEAEIREIVANSYPDTLKVRKAERHQDNFSLVYV